MSTTYGPKVVDNGLVFYLDIANPKSYIGSGTQIVDMIQGQVCDIYGASDGFFGGKYLETTGPLSHFYIRALADQWMLDTMDISVGGWTMEDMVMYYSTNYPEATAPFGVGHGYANYYVGWDLNHANYLSYGYYLLEINATGKSGNLANQVNVLLYYPDEFKSFNKWLNRVVYFNRTDNTVGLYINGYFCSSANISAVAGWSIYDTSSYGGHMYFGTVYGWMHHGRKSFIKFYNKVLTADEVKQNYNELKSRYGL